MARHSARVRVREQSGARVNLERETLRLAIIGGVAFAIGFALATVILSRGEA